MVKSIIKKFSEQNFKAFFKYGVFAKVDWQIRNGLQNCKTWFMRKSLFL